MKNIIIAILMSVIGTSAFAGSVVKTDTTVELLGKVDQRMWIQFSELVADDTVTAIKIQSPGGYVQYGKKITDYIYAHPAITTEATGTCASMCAAIWMAAEDHVYNPNQKIGFHLSYVADKNALRNYLVDEGIKGLIEFNKKSVLNDMTRDFKNINNKEYFGDFMEGISKNAVRPNQMWYPTDFQLQQWEGPYVG